MKLSTLVENLGVKSPPQSDTRQGQASDPVIAGLALDSRLVDEGYLFAALPGEVSDGRDFIPAALKAGANSILLPTGSVVDDDLLAKAIILEHHNPRKALAEMAGRFYAPHPKHCVAITGTNGKTSVASFVKQIWASLGFDAGSIGTLGVISNKVNKAGSLTTPDTIEFHKNLQQLAQSGVDHVIFEASSHGLSQYRLDGVKISVAGFTNLSREHLDYHGDMENYFEAKSRLFVELLEENGSAVINIDNRWGQKLAQLCEANRRQLITIGVDEDAAMRLMTCEKQSNGYSCKVGHAGEVYEFNLPLIGKFQVENALMAAGIVISEGCDAKAVFAALENLHGVDGRMELAGTCPNGAPVLLDYAHTPDALENALASLQSYREKGRIFIVFGCGGNRDKGKRPIMGSLAAKLADQVFVTDDNPRNEDPKQIRSEILAGAPSAYEFDDRGVAINTAVQNLEENDILLVSGKGHEQGQIVGEKVLPFSDLTAVRDAIKKIDKTGART